MRINDEQFAELQRQAGQASVLTGEVERMRQEMAALQQRLNEAQAQPPSAAAPAMGDRTSRMTAATGMDAAQAREQYGRTAVQMAAMAQSNPAFAGMSLETIATLMADAAVTVSTDPVKRALLEHNLQMQNDQQAALRTALALKMALQPDPAQAQAVQPAVDPAEWARFQAWQAEQQRAQRRDPNPPGAPAPAAG